MPNPGEIKSIDYAKQLISFSGMVWPGVTFRGNISPTDIDAFIDFGGIFYVIIDYQHKGKNIGLGQVLALERICDALESSGAVAIAIIAEHNQQAPEIVDGKSAKVIRYRFCKMWIEVNKNEIISCKNFIDHRYNIFVKKNKESELTA